MAITPSDVWDWMPTSALREGEANADAIMTRLVESVELHWIERWSSVIADDVATVTAADDLVTLTAHGYVNTNRLVPWQVFNSTTGVHDALPAPLTDRVYFVRDATANTFKVATVSGGAAVDITVDGSVRIAPAVRPSYIDQALIMQAAALWGRRKILNGVIAGSETMGPFRVGRFDPDIERLLFPRGVAVG